MNEHERVNHRHGGPDHGEAVSLELEPVARESTAGIIARQLRTAITNGSLAPGTQLGEAELANRFQVSRGPLREAMQRLVQEGLLRSEPHRGLFVIDLEPGDVYDIYAARTAVESAAAVRVVRGADTADRAIEVLRGVHARMAASAVAGNAAGVTDADLEFHETLVAVSGSPRLVRMMRTLMVETRMCLSALHQATFDVHERVAEHGHILDALADADEALAGALLERHMEDAVRRLAPGTSLLTPTAPAVAPDGAGTVAGDGTVSGDEAAPARRPGDTKPRGGTKNAAAATGTGARQDGHAARGRRS